MSDEPTAAVRYKEIMGLARKAADDLRDWERKRIVELESEIAEADRRLDAAAEQETAVQERALRWWRMACDNVDRLPWLEPGEQPSPISSARGDRAVRYVDELRGIYRELTEAIASLGWRARR
ncbi:hypothetical protein [Saccharomonospora sp.]|uniref:hypothetical protein n=1 Tax=Saccharomonospora sp. TaxID=33913 RepID=UPI00261860D3|nr:hypothetical protein [Saccharomonospora sp.]